MAMIEKNFGRRQSRYNELVENLVEFLSFVQQNVPRNVFQSAKIQKLVKLRLALAQTGKIFKHDQKVRLGIDRKKN